MTNFLYFDTETSDYSEPDRPALPVEIAFLLANEDRVWGAHSSIIKQSHWVGMKHDNPIAERVVKIHGITEKIAAMFGDAPDPVLHLFRRMLACADAVVAHNIAFDLIVMNHAAQTQQLPGLPWPQSICTMRGSATITKIPSGGRWAIEGFKAPKLSEAYAHFSGREMRDAHSGLADVFACRLVHRGMLAHEAKKREAVS